MENSRIKRTQIFRELSFLSLFSQSHSSTNTRRRISVICLMNWAKSEYNNPREISGRAPVIPLMTSLMKVTSLQNGGCSFVPPHCTERGWPEETGSTHFWLVTAAYTDSPSGSVAIRAQDWCVFLTNSPDGHLYGETLPGNVRGRVT